MMAMIQRFGGRVSKWKCGLTGNSGSGLANKSTSRLSRFGSETLEQVAHLALLGLQILARNPGDARLARHAFHHADTRRFQLPHLVGVVGKQPDPRGAQLPEDLRREVVLAGIRRKSQR